MSSLTIASFLRLYIRKMVSLGVYRWTDALGGGLVVVGASMFGSLGMCALHGRGLWDQKKYSISLFSVLNRVAIIFECILPLNRVRIEGFQQHNQTFFKFPPTPQGKVSSPTHNKNLAKQALQGFFFWVKNQVKEKRGFKSNLPWSRVWHD